jgi:hypothetical protein
MQDPSYVELRETLAPHQPLTLPANRNALLEKAFAANDGSMSAGAAMDSAQQAALLDLLRSLLRRPGKGSKHFTNRRRRIRLARKKAQAARLKAARRHNV